MNPTIPAGDVGWKMNLQDARRESAGRIANVPEPIYFTTYSPQERAYNPEYCVATVGLNRLYVVDAATAKPVVNFDHPTSPPTDISDRFKELAQGSIAPEAIFVFPTPDATPRQSEPACRCRRSAWSAWRAAAPASPTRRCALTGNSAAPTDWPGRRRGPAALPLP